MSVMTQSDEGAVLYLYLHPWCLTTALGWLGNLSFCIEIKMLFTVPWISQVQSTGLLIIFPRAEPCLVVRLLARHENRLSRRHVFPWLSEFSLYIFQKWVSVGWLDTLLAKTLLIVVYNCNGSTIYCYEWWNTCI